MKTTIEITVINVKDFQIKTSVRKVAAPMNVPENIEKWAGNCVKAQAELLCKFYHVQAESKWNIANDEDRTDKTRENAQKKAIAFDRLVDAIETEFKVTAPYEETENRIERVTAYVLLNKVRGTKRFPVILNSFDGYKLFELAKKTADGTMNEQAINTFKTACADYMNTITANDGSAPEHVKTEYMDYRVKRFENRFTQAQARELIHNAGSCFRAFNTGGVREKRLAVTEFLKQVMLSGLAKTYRFSDIAPIREGHTIDA